MYANMIESRGSDPISTGKSDHIDAGRRPILCCWTHGQGTVEHIVSPTPPALSVLLAFLFARWAFPPTRGQPHHASPIIHSASCGNVRQPHDDYRFTSHPLRGARNRCPSGPQLKTSVGRPHRRENIGQRQHRH